MSRHVSRRAGQAAILALASAVCVFSPTAYAADSASIVPGTLVQGTVKASLGAGTTYALDTNNLGDWPLNTGGSAATTYAISMENPDFNTNSFGGAGNTMVAFGDGGGVTLQLATPITPATGRKDLGIFTAQAITGGTGSLFNGNMQAAILVSADGVSWFTLTGQAVSSPTTYTATSYELNAPTMAYNYGTAAAAWQDGAGTSASNLSALTIADFITPMPDDSLFNDPASTNAQRLALTTDSSTADYAAIFGDSGGGNWFDVSGSGLSQVEYIRLNGVDVPSTGGIRLDAVFANASAVPEPASLGLILLGGMALLKRRR